MEAVTQLRFSKKMCAHRVNNFGAAEVLPEKHSFNGIHSEPFIPIFSLIIKITMEHYTVISSGWDAKHQPHLLVHFKKFETISALAEEVEKLSRLPLTSFPQCPPGAIVRLGANGQLLDKNSILKNVIPDPRAIVLFASYSFPEDDISGQTVGLTHSAPQHIIFDQNPLFDNDPVEPTTDRVPKRSRSEQDGALQEGSVAFASSDNNPSQSPGPVQQPFPGPVEKKSRNNNYRAHQGDPNTYTSGMLRDVSGDSNAPVIILNVNRPEGFPKKVPQTWTTKTANTGSGSAGVSCHLHIGPKNLSTNVLCSPPKPRPSRRQQHSKRGLNGNSVRCSDD